MAGKAEKNVAAADELRTAVSKKSGTIAEIVNTLDGWAL